MRTAPAHTTYHPILSAIGETFCETVWPTRCAICDTPGECLCERCKLKLSYIDYNLKCPTCGSEHGITQCLECNSYSIRFRDSGKLIYDKCLACVQLDDMSSRLIRTWKDAGERRIAKDMAIMMRSIIPKDWACYSPTLVPIPASKTAYRRRGFDHVELLAIELANVSKLRWKRMFERPQTYDQRKLSKEQRFANMANSFCIKQNTWIPYCVILVDDVQTTGATLSAASKCLKEAGVTRVYCLTFARA